MTFAALILASYLLGSVPAGLWLGRWWKGVDVRERGSGNLGATNVFRVLGVGPGICTLAIDIAKGLVPVCAAKALFPGGVPALIGAGLAAIIGHTCSIFVRFRGGKGVATSAGVFAGLLPMPFLFAVIAFFLLLTATRYVSVSSMGAVIVLAAASFALKDPEALSLMAAGVAIFVLWTHRANLRRLMNGTEPKLSAPGRLAS